MYPGPLTATRVKLLSLQGAQRRLHRVGGGVLHVGQNVRVSVESHSYGGAAEHLGDDLRIYAFAEEQRGTRVLRSWKRRSSRTPTCALMCLYGLL
jgi:hypothetical protein